MPPVLMPHRTRKIARQGKKQPDRMFGHGHAEYASGIRNHDARIPQLRIHQLRHSRGSGMNPLQFLCTDKLIDTQGVANENIRVRKFFRQTCVIRQMHDAHFRPATSYSRSHLWLRPPLGKGMPDADGEFGVLRPGPEHVNSQRMRRSCPVMSAGADSPRIPSIVGAISRRAPPDAYLSLSFSVTQINGTGFVVWYVCGPPPAGSIIVSALPWSAVMIQAPPRGFNV